MGKHSELMDEWFRRVWNENDTAFIHEACDIDMTTKGHRGRPLLGPDDFLDFHGIISALVDNIHIKVLRCIEEGDWASVLYEFSSTKKGCDTPVVFTGSSMLRIQNGKIAEVYEHVDFIEFFKRTGALPDNTLEHCLGGKSIS